MITTILAIAVSNLIVIIFGIFDRKPIADLLKVLLIVDVMTAAALAFCYIVYGV